MEGTKTSKSEAPQLENKTAENMAPPFDPDKAKKMRGEAFFNINPDNYEIFSKQAALKGNREVTLNINETLGRMVGSTAMTIAAITGEDKNNPPCDHVIYLDKSARPVSWLVDAFWEDMTDAPRPEESFLAIDRRVWFKRCGLQLLPGEYIEEPSGAQRPAAPYDFNINKIPKEDIAGIRSLYIPEGIETEDVVTIMATPTSLDGKHIMVIDEVSRTGSTLSIAKQLIEAAIPDAIVHTHVFWDAGLKSLPNGEQQMGPAVVWYPTDHTDWRGRGVKDVNPAYFKRQFKKNPTPKNRAYLFGSLVLGEPLDNREDEPEQLSWKLKEEISRLHNDYKLGRILPSPIHPIATKKMMSYLSNDCGVMFIPEEDNPHSYISLLKKRDQ